MMANQNNGGQPAVTSLKKTDPFRQETCRFLDPTCIVEKGKDCALMGCIYEITCDACEDPVDLTTGGPLDKDTKDPGKQRRPNYVGMTSTSVHWRMQGHLSGQKSKSSGNPLWRHDSETHGGNPQTYTTRILRRERTLLPLTVVEALFIEKQYPETSLNDKNEAGRGGLIRLVARRS